MNELNVGFPSGSVTKNLPAMQKTQVQFLGWEDPLEEDMATDSNILAWRILWLEEPGGLQSHRLTKSWTQLKRLSTHHKLNALAS